MSYRPQPASVSTAPDLSATAARDETAAASSVSAGKTTLAARLAAAPPAARASLLAAAVAAGEPIVLPGADLRGVHFPAAAEETVPAPVSLDGINLAGATLSGACLAGVSLRGACLDGALRAGAARRGADLTAASLRGANLTGARLMRSILSYADLRRASLLTADLSEVTATGADLREALLQSAVLKRALLRSADLSWARLDGANLRWAELDGARFEGAVLALASFGGARLSATTDFSRAFLHHASFERTDLCRAHLGGGIGEEFTHLALARDTYRALRSHFEACGRRADAQWAHRQAWRAETAMHRPDRARRYFGIGSPHGQPGPAALCRRIRSFTGHFSLWLLGLMAAAISGYGTSFRRMVAAVVTVWLLFALLYGHAGAVIHLSGQPVHWYDVLRYSAAALTPIDAYPLVATTDMARAAAVAEGVLGLALVGALGYMAVERLRRG